MCDTWYKHEGKPHLYLEGYGPLLGFGFGQELLEEMKTAQVDDEWMMAFQVPLSTLDQFQESKVNE